MIRRPTSTSVSAARAEGQMGGRRREPDSAGRHEMAESVITCRKPEARNGAALPYQPATVSRIAAEHPEPDPIVTQEPARGTAYACLQEATPKGRLSTPTTGEEDCCDSRRVAGPASDGELSLSYCWPQPR